MRRQRLFFFDTPERQLVSPLIISPRRRRCCRHATPVRRRLPSAAAAASCFDATLPDYRRAAAAIVFAICCQPSATPPPLFACAAADVFRCCRRLICRHHFRRCRFRCRHFAALSLRRRFFDYAMPLPAPRHYAAYFAAAEIRHAIFSAACRHLMPAALLRFRFYAIDRHTDRHLIAAAADAAPRAYSLSRRRDAAIIAGYAAMPQSDASCRSPMSPLFVNARYITPLRHADCRRRH